MIRLGTAACASRSSEASRWACTASVSKSNGRMIMVAGSSFITSTKTISIPVSRLPFRIGRCTSPSTRGGPRPRVRATASIRGLTVARPAS